MRHNYKFEIQFILIITFFSWKMQSKLLYLNKQANFRKVLNLDLNVSFLFITRFISNSSTLPTSPQSSSASNLSPRYKSLDSKRIQPSLDNPNQWSQYARNLVARYSQPTLKVNNEFYEDPLLYSWLSHNLPKEVTRKL